MTDTDLKKTPLYNLHVELGAKMVDFAGWSMPVQYAGDNGGIMNEHAQCRNKAALFDVSHMGQVILKGDNPAKAMETLVPAALTELAEGRARYTFFTNDAGGILDDLIVSNAGDHLFVVVNAALRDQDIPYMRKELTGLDITEIHDRALIAVQGPAAEKVVAKHCPQCQRYDFYADLKLPILWGWNAACLGWAILAKMAMKYPSQTPRPNGLLVRFYKTPIANLLGWVRAIVCGWRQGFAFMVTILTPKPHR